MASAPWVPRMSAAASRLSRFFASTMITLRPARTSSIKCRRCLSSSPRVLANVRWNWARNVCSAPVRSARWRSSSPWRTSMSCRANPYCSKASMAALACFGSTMVPTTRFVGYAMKSSGWCMLPASSSAIGGRSYTMTQCGARQKKRVKSPSHTSRRTGTRRPLEQLPEQPPELLACLLGRRSVSPRFQRQTARPAEVHLEVFRQSQGKVGLRDRHVDLVVQLQRAVVEVGGSDDAPDPVDDEGLHMHHRRLELVDLNPGGEQPIVVGTAGVFHGLRVGEVALDEQPHAHTPAARLGQGPSRRLVEHHIGRLQVERAPGTRQAEQVQQLHAVAAA